MGTDGEIPAHSTTYMETACTYNDPVVMHPFAYRTHAHTHGTSLTSDIDTGQLFTALPDPDPSDAGPNPLCISDFDRLYDETIWKKMYNTTVA